MSQTQRRDRLLRFTLLDNQARVLLCESTHMAQEAMNIHEMSHVAAAACGRVMTAVSMLSFLLKEAQSSVTVTVDGGGPLGKITCVGEHGYCRVSVQNPQAELPLRADGKLDVGRAVGKQGKLTVIQDIGLRVPYIGQSDLVSGEIGEDFARYFALSAQQPSLVALGVLVSGNWVLSSGGVLIQPLPGCSEEALRQLELRSPLFGQISRDLSQTTLDELAQDAFRGLQPVLLEESDIGYRCTCSRERMARALVSLGGQELREMVEENKDITMGCHFCRRACTFTPPELSALYASAVGKAAQKQESEGKHEA